MKQTFPLVRGGVKSFIKPSTRRDGNTTLRTGANWGAIAAEYLHGEPPATPLGRAEADYLARRAGGGADLSLASAG